MVWGPNLVGMAEVSCGGGGMGVHVIVVVMGMLGLSLVMVVGGSV